MSFDLAQRYTEARQKALAGERGLQRLSESDLKQLTQSLVGPELERHQALFLLAHASHPVRELEATLLVLPTHQLNDEDLVWLLNCFQKHIIQGRFKEGERLTHDFLETLRKLIHHSSRPVVEWVLRTIDECSSQGIVFRPELAKIKPSIWSLWRAESRTILELITYLERKWSP
ncbi:MAG: hypothetical protein ACLGG0_04225 [Bacteriovoracia bacterium]